MKERTPNDVEALAALANELRRRLWAITESKLSATTHPSEHHKALAASVLAVSELLKTITALLKILC